MEFRSFSRTPGEPDTFPSARERLDSPFAGASCTLVYSGMDSHPPTYRLGPDFETKLESFTNAFLTAGWEVFASEFANLESFLVEAQKDDPERDDLKLRGTEKPLYLLEAISYRIYDTVNREKFNQTTNTIIVLPDCLTLHNPYCEKADLPHGDECAGCTPDCPANRVEELANRYGAKVVFSKRMLKEQLEYQAEQTPHLGVIGIGCLLMLAKGMRTAMELDLPVRGIPLNYCGCDHWTDDPVGTSFPIERLAHMLEEKHAASDSTSHT